MCNFKIWFHSTGRAPEGDVFLSVTFPESSSLIQNFTATLTEAAADEERAKKMYLDTLAPGTVSPPVLLGEPQDDANIDIYILGLTKYTVTYVPGFVTVFLYALTMLIFRITRIISREKWFNHVSLSCLENVQNLGRSDDGKQRKKKPNAMSKQHKCLYVDNTTFISLTPDISFYLDKIHR